MFRFTRLGSANGRRLDIRYKDKNHGRYQALFFFIRITIGSIFVYAGLHKIVSPEYFADILYGYDILPDAFINITTIILPFVEVLSGLILITGLLQKPSLLMVNTLLLCFIIMTGFNLLRGHQYDCGCFSFSKQTFASHIYTILVDSMMLAAGIFLFRKKRR